MTWWRRKKSLLVLALKSRDGVVGSTIRDSIPRRAKRFFLFQNVQTVSGAHPVSYSIDTGAVSQR
jgi:hypothetical protein